LPSTPHSMMKNLFLILLVLLALQSVAQNPAILIFDKTNSGLQYSSINPPDSVGDPLGDFQSSIAFDNSCNYYVGSEGGGLCIYDGLNWSQLTRENTDTAINSDFVNAVYVEPNGIVWVGNAGLNGVVRVRPEDTMQFNTGNTAAGLPNHLFVTSIVSDSSGNVWVATDGGVGVFDGDSWTPYTTMNGLPDNGLKTIIFDKWQNSIWVGSTTGGAARFKDGSWQTFDTSNSGLPGNNVNSIVVDTDGAIWFGTFFNGIAKLLDTTWTYYTMPDLPSNTVTSLAIDQDGKIWVGTNAWIGIYDGISWSALNASDSLPHNWIRSLAVDPLNNLCIATENGFVIYKSGGVNFCLTFETDNICSDDSLGSITVEPQFGSGTYQYIWDDPSAQTSPTASGLLAGMYRVTVTDVSGTDSGYFAIDSVILYESSGPINITVSIIDSPSYSGSDGNLELEVTGGDAPYTYNWSNGSTTKYLSSIPKGMYSVTVTDILGCTATITIDLATGLARVETQRGFREVIYPNPFKDNTSVMLLVEQGGRYSLKLFDINGRAQLVLIRDQYLGSGIHTFQIQGEQLAPGLYYLRLESLMRTETRKLIHIW